MPKLAQCGSQMAPKLRQSQRICIPLFKVSPVEIQGAILEAFYVYLGAILECFGGVFIVFIYIFEWHSYFCHPGLLHNSCEAPVRLLRLAVEFQWDSSDIAV